MSFKLGEKVKVLQGSDIWHSDLSYDEIYTITRINNQGYIYLDDSVFWYSPQDFTSAIPDINEAKMKEKLGLK